MRKLLVLLLLFQSCNKSSIGNISSEPPGVTAVNRIHETSEVIVEMIDKYEAFFKDTSINIQMLDAELSKLLLMQKTDYLVLAQEKCSGDSNNKYWESECTFGEKSSKSDQVKKTGNENPDSIEIISSMNTFLSESKSDPIERINVLKSDTNERTKLHIAFEEYKIQLLSIKKRKYDCYFRKSLLYSYVLITKIFNIKTSANE
jgi:hypothetical protein